MEPFVSSAVQPKVREHDFRPQDLRVLNLVTQLEGAGAQTIALSLHRQFVLRGVTSKMLFLYEKDGRAFPQRDYEILLPSKPYGFADIFKILWKLKSAWRTFEPTHVIAHTHYAFIIAGILGRMGLRGRVVAVHHNVFGSYPQSVAVLDCILGFVAAYDEVVAVSQTTSKTLTHYPLTLQSRVVAIPNAQCMVTSKLSRNAARTKFNIPSDAFVIGTVGRLTEQKNQTFLIDVLSRLPDAQLVVLGEGNLRGEIQTHIDRLNLGSRVRLLGSVVHEEVPHFLRALDVFALPSLHEGSSVAMLEAMAAGLTVVGSDVPTIANELKFSDGRMVGVVLPLEPAAWLQSFQQLSQNVNFRRKLGAKAKLHARSYSIESMAQKYLNLLCDASGSR